MITERILFMKIGLRIKFMIFFIIFTILISYSIYYFSVKNYIEVVEEKYINEAITIGKTANSYITPIQLKYYTNLIEAYNKEPNLDEDYYKITNLLDSLRKATNAQKIYIVKILNDTKLMYFHMSLEDNINNIHLGNVYNNYNDQIFNNLKQSLLKNEIYTNLNGDDVIAYIPIIDNNISIGFTAVEVNMSNINDYIKENLNEMIKILIFILTFCLIILLLFIQITVLNPIKLLKINVEDMANGNLGAINCINSKDEIGEIAKIVNRMSLNISGHVKEIERLNEAYYKFIPFKIFEIIGKKSIIDVKLGDQSNMNMTVLSIQTNDFDDVVRRLPTEQILNYITDVLDICVPTITAKEGVIERFKNSGLTAFYTNSPEQALLAAISTCQAMDKAEFTIKYANISNNIQMSVGITYGTAMLGIVGHDKRLEAITISENVAMAQFLQKIASKYNSKIIITANAVIHIDNFEERYNSRFVGMLYITSSKKLEKIYDVFDGDLEENIILKKQTKHMFEKGVNLYCAKKFYEARLAFIEVLKVFRKDEASKNYLYLCDKYYQLDNLDKVNSYIEIY